MVETLLEIKDVTFAYGDHTILSQLSLNIKKREIAVIIGPSGSGKTTLFKLIAGILQPDEGTIYIANATSSNTQNNVAYMMQEDLLLPWRSVLNNVTLITELGSQVTADDVQKEAIQLLHDVGLAGCEELFPHQLSGGMRQRVSLARAIMQKRPLLLLDEPFGSLDVSLREHMYKLLHRIHKKYQTTILMITHDFRDAISVADRILVFNKHNMNQEWNVTQSMRDDPVENARLAQELRTAIVDNQLLVELRT